MYFTTSFRHNNVPVTCPPDNFVNNVMLIDKKLLFKYFLYFVSKGDRDSGITSRSRSVTAEPAELGEHNSDRDTESDGDSSFHSHSSNPDKDYIDEPRKPKRTRTAFSNYQLDQLELVFSQTQYPDVFVREDLSTRLGIKEDRIQVRKVLHM